MDTSNTKTNIGAAFEVVRKTYANLDKFFKELDEVADKNGYYLLTTSTPRFLRYKSDADSWGWMLSDFIKLYQRKDAPDTENESIYKDAPVYGLNVSIESTDGPVIHLIKYEYDDIASWTGAIPLNSHWQFYWPLHSSENFEIVQESSDKSVSVPRDIAHADAKYFRLRKASWCTRELVGLTQENLVNLIEGWKEL